MMKDPFKKHQMAIARKTLQLSDLGIQILGGMTKLEARNILLRAGHIHRVIRRIN